MVVRGRRHPSACTPSEGSDSRQQVTSECRHLYCFCCVKGHRRAAYMDHELTLTRAEGRFSRVPDLFPSTLFSESVKARRVETSVGGPDDEEDVACAFFFFMHSERTNIFKHTL